MKPWAEMTAGARGGVVGVVAAVVALLLYGAWSVRGPGQGVEVSGEVTPTGSEAAVAPEAAGAAEGAAVEPEAGAAAQAVDEVAAAAEPVAEEAGAAVEGDGAAAEEAAVEEAAAEEAEGAVVAEEAAPVAPPAPAAPVFDLVRVERDGSALVAGKAEAGSTLSLRVTGQEIAAVPADGAGNFVAMFNLAPSEAPRVLSLVMRLADGTDVPADATVVIAPTVAPLAVAGADTEAAVGAETAPAALLVTEAGTKVLQSAEEMPAELVANVTIDTITYTPEGAVQLAGRGTAERAVRVYLDNAPVADAVISAAGDWAVTLGDVVAGVYTLRVDQLDAAGAVTSRFETPFKRETVAALAEASGAEPAGAEPAGVETAEAEAETQAETSGTEAAAQAEAEPAEAAVTEEAAAEAAEPAGEGEPAAGPSTVTVQPGFTLWRIASENLGDGVRYVQVFEANKDQIRDPDLIYPGQVFTIPQAE